MKFSVQQKLLSLSDCERLTGRWSREVEILASQCGGRQSLPGQRVELPLRYALNMLIMSEVMKHSVEPASMAPWLPGLRTEALLTLGEEIANWSYEGPSDRRQEFLTKLYGERDAVRPRIAPLLGCSGTKPIRRLRFHSQSDIECLSNSELHNERRERTPMFVLEAHDLVARIEATCGGPLFTVTLRTTSDTWSSSGQAWSSTLPLSDDQRPRA